MNPDDVGLHNLQPAPGAKRDRKRVGRGHGSGHGKTSGRGHKGYGARAGAKDRARFDDGASVDLAALKAAGLATRRDVPVKVLGRGELSKKLTVHAHAFSKSARERIESAGGTCQLLEP